MYVQLTEKCNMTCAHCCFAATAKGDNMDRYTFTKALELAVDRGDYVTLGGGEPTLHPEFFEYLDKTMELYTQRQLEMSPLVITNGKLVSKARKLLQYVEEERPVWVELSLDEFHDPIRPEIETAFRAYQCRRDQSSRWGKSDGPSDRGAGVRTVNRLVAVGRAADAARGLTTDPSFKCACEDLLVDPHGNIFSCGCKTHLLGNIFEADITDILCDFDRDTAHEGGGLPSREHARLPLALPKAA